MTREMNGKKSESGRWSRWFSNALASIKDENLRESCARASRIGEIIAQSWKPQASTKSSWRVQYFTSDPRAADRQRSNARARSLALEVGVIASRRKKNRINETDRPVTSLRFTCLPTVARCRRPNLLRVKRGTASTYVCVIFEILSQTFL